MTDGDGSTVLVIGEGDLSDEVAVESAGADVERLRTPDEDEIRDALEGSGVDSVAVVGRDDAFVLGMALIVRSISEDVPLLLTIFEKTMARQISEDVPNTQVTSLADIVAPSLGGTVHRGARGGGECRDDSPALLVEEEGDLAEEPVPQLKAHRIEALAKALFTPYDKSAGLLLHGAIGLVVVFLIETISAVLVTTTRSWTRSTAPPRPWSRSIQTSTSTMRLTLDSTDAERLTGRSRLAIRLVSAS